MSHQSHAAVRTFDPLHHTIRIAGMYLIVAALWIVLSDWAVASLASAENVTQWQTYKGWGFVAVTGGLLFALVRRTLTELSTSQIELNRQYTYLNTLFMSAPVALVTLDGDGMVTTWNAAAEELFGWTEADTMGRPAPFFESSPGADRLRSIYENARAGSVQRDLELNVLTMDGKPRHVCVFAAPLPERSGQSGGAMLVLSDLSDRKRLEREVYHLATCDPLTDLSNRRTFETKLAQSLRSLSEDAPPAVILLDIDHFSLMNDCYGHEAGDRLLINVARRLKRALPESATLSRLNGDVFAVLLDQAAGAEATELADRLRDTIASGDADFSGGPSFDLSVSAGVAIADEECDPPRMLTMAETALTAAKVEGKNRTVLYTPEHETARTLTETTRWATRVKEALREERFVLYYQPVVRLSSGAAEHFEALVRMRDENGEIVPPGLFLPAAERFGLMPQLDRWVFAEALRMMEQVPDTRFFVNLSAQSLNDSATLGAIESRLRQRPDLARRLVFEITETVAILNFECAERWMQGMQSYGCGFALDDFGIGFSSFTYLRTLPVDYVKIDGSFVRTITTNEESRAMVQALSHISRTMGKTTIAEWVEDADTAAALAEMDIDFGQGYHWGAPSPTIQALSAAA